MARDSVKAGYQASRRGHSGAVAAHGNRRYKIGKAAARGVSHAPETAASGAGSAASSATSASVGAATSQGIIVTSALVTFGLGFLNSYLVPRKTPRIRLYMGVALLYIGLSVVDQFSPKFAKGFAVLVMITAILGEGGGVLNWLMGRGTHDHIGITTTGTPNLPPVNMGRPPIAALPAPTGIQNTFQNLNVRQP